MTEWQFQSATGQVAAILVRRIRSVELLTLYKQRIEKRNPEIIK